MSAAPLRSRLGNVLIRSETLFPDTLFRMQSTKRNRVDATDKSRFPRLKRKRRTGEIRRLRFSLGNGLFVAGIAESGKLNARPFMLSPNRFPRYTHYLCYNLTALVFCPMFRTRSGSAGMSGPFTVSWPVALLACKGNLFPEVTLWFEKGNSNGHPRTGRM